MEIHKMLALSTGHLTIETRQLVDRFSEEKWTHDNYPAYHKKEYGWFVYVPAEIEDIPPSLPTDLEACLYLAHHQGCGWIMFDRDVDPIQELPEFEP